jgi:hypothetical protein
VSIQTRLDKHYAKLRRRHFDLKVKTKGREIKVVKLNSTIIQTRGIELGSEEAFFDGAITVVLLWPGEIPMDRVRYTGPDDRVENTNPFFFDILPIEIWSKFEDHVAKGDLLVLRFFDEGENCFSIVLKVEESFGSFREHLVWKKHQCSIFNDELPEDIMELIR